MALDPVALDPVALDPDATVPDPDEQAAGEELPADGEHAGGRRNKSWRQLMMVVLAAIVLMLLIKAFVVQVYRIPSSSMEDTLLTGDRVLVNKLVYDVRGIARGDIVVFSGTGSWGTTTGEPDPSPPANRLLRDEKSYLFPGARPSMKSFNVLVPPGRLWVMGDNRAISDDSRGHMSAGSPDMGTVPENEVAGRAFMVIWPPSQIGDLPIPATFQQAALHAGAAGALVLQVAGSAAAAVTAVPAAGAAALLGIPVLALRTPRTRRPRVRAGRPGRPRGYAGARR